MVNVNDVCAVPMLADMPEAKVDFSGDSSEFGMIMQKSLAEKGDVGENVGNAAQNRADNANEQVAEIDEKPDVSQNNQIATTAAPVLINQQIIPTLEPSVVVLDLTNEAAPDVVSAIDGIAKSDTAVTVSADVFAARSDTAITYDEFLAVNHDIAPDISQNNALSVGDDPDMQDVRTDLPVQDVVFSDNNQFEFAADAANVQISDADSVVPTAKQSVPMASTAPLADTEPLVNTVPLADTEPIPKSAPLADAKHLSEPLAEYSPVAEIKPLKEPVTLADTEQILQSGQQFVSADYLKSGEPIKAEQRGFIANAYQSAQTTESIDDRPVVEMFNRKVYLDRLPQENTTIISNNTADNSENAIADNAADSGFGNIADVSALADKLPIAADVKANGENVLQKSDADIQPVNVLQNAENTDAVSKIGNDLRNTAANLQNSEGNAGAKNSNDSDLSPQLTSQVVSSYSDVSANTVESAQPLENVSQTDSVKNQIIEQIFDKFNAGKTEFQIEIKPRELGTVTVKMAVKGAEMVIELIARDSRTQNIIISNSNEIKTILQEQLNHNVTVEVVHDDNGSTHYDDADSQHAQQQQQDAQQQKNDDDGNNNFTVDFVTLMQMLSKQ